VYAATSRRLELLESNRDFVGVGGVILFHPLVVNSLPVPPNRRLSDSQRSRYFAATPFASLDEFDLFERCPSAISSAVCCGVGCHGRES
jgi:hypothetical protein